MSPKLLMLLIVCTLNLVLAILVYLKNSKHLVNQLFGAFALCMAAWGLSAYMVHAITDKGSSLQWGRIAFGAASLIPLSFLAFSQAFPTQRSFSIRIDLLIFGILGISFALLSFSPLLLVDVTFGAQGIETRYGPAHSPFGLYFLSCLGYAFFILAKKWRRTRGIARLQVQYLFLGTLLAGCAGTTTNLIIPLLFHSSRLSAYGPSFSIIMIGMIAHAIVRYRLMDIKVVIKRGVVYSVSAVAVAGCVVGLVLLIERTMGYRLPYSSFAFIGFIALCLAIVFQPLKSLVQSLADRYFYRERYNYQRILREASRVLTSVLDLDSLLEYIGATVVQTMKTEWAYLFLYDEKTGGFQPKMGKALVGERSILSFLPDSCPLVKTLKQEEEILVREEIERRLPLERAAGIQVELERLQCDIALPMFAKGDLVGILLLGPKFSGDPYFQEDLELLSTIADQAAVAIRNAQLYREVVWLNEYNESILENMESGVVTVNSEGRVTVFNEAAERMTGFLAQNIVGKRVNALDPSFSEPIMAALSEGKLYSHSEGTLNTRGSSPTPIIFSTSLLQDQQGQDSGAIMVFSDLSRIKKLEEEKNRAERLASVGALAADLAHEIKNPLVAIKTFAELLPERFSDAEFRENFLKVAAGEIERIDSLVTQLCGLARHGPSKLEAVDLGLLLEETLSLLSGQIERQGIQVIKDLSDDLPPFWADEGQLKQLFLNLLKNSLEAMPEGGLLMVATFHGRGKRKDKEFLGVRISDTGVGIPEEDLERIFDPFFTTKEKGTGLGLTICHKIVEDHQGSISVENNTDSPGVTVTVRFPALYAGGEKLHEVGSADRRST